MNAHAIGPFAPRPRARGWIHLVAVCLTPALAGVMIALAAVHSGLAALGTSIYCASMAATFGVSALYHRRQWGERGWQVMRRLDHAMIFIFIAGSYTPFGLMALSGATRWWLLGTVWAGCAAGIALKLTNPHGARWLTVPVYLAVGWPAIFVAGDLLSGAGVAALTLIVVGGALYSVGAIVFATHRPDPSPGTFGYHEVFHLLTVLAAICHYVAIFLAIYRTPLAA